MLDRIVEGLVPRRGPGLEPLRIPTTLRAGPRPAPPSSPGRLWIRGQLTPHNPRRLSPCVDRPVDNYTLVFPHLCPQMWMNHRGVLSALSFKASRAAQCFSGAVRLMCCLLASETLARTGVRGRLVVLEATRRGGKRPGGSWQVAGVHSADINPASGLRVGEEPQDSNDPRWVLRWQARSCQRCGHRAARE